jgi:nucleotide-binding universal stress UspA family protein
MLKKVLLAYDGSENAKRALEMAIDIASHYAATLTIVEVVDIHSISYVLAPHGPSIDIDRVIEDLRAKASGDIRQCIKIAEENGLEADGDVLEGDPATEVLRHSGEMKADLIVTGSRGLSLWKRLLMGSVSHRIVSESKVATLVVR